MRSILLYPRQWKTRVWRGLFLGLAIGGAFLLGWCNQPPPVVQTIEGAVRYVPAAVITRRESDAKVGKIESIAHPKVKPDYTAIAKHGADSTVQAFCAKDTAVREPTDSAGSVSTAHPPVLLVRSMREDSRLFPFSKSPMYVVGVSSNGDLSERRYELRQGARWRADGDSLVVQQPRIPAKPIVGAALLVGFGYLAGHFIH